MDAVGESSESGFGVSNSQLMKIEAFGDDESCPKQVSTIRGGGSRNTSPLGHLRSRNSSPLDRKINTKPRGLDVETTATFHIY